MWEKRASLVSFNDLREVTREEGRQVMGVWRKNEWNKMIHREQKGGKNEVYSRRNARTRCTCIYKDGYPIPLRYVLTAR